MRVAIKDFAEFYQTELGKFVAELVAQYTKNSWTNNPETTFSHEDILGYGFCPPILARLDLGFARKINYIVQNEFETEDLALAQNNWVFGEETRTPFQDGQFEKILCLSGIEESENPIRTLRELWRILAPEGSLVLVVPNRRGIWARFDSSPFGSGRPYSRTQLINLISQSMFETEIATRILYAPPIENSFIQKSFRHFENIGQKIWPTFGGLLFFKLKKRVLIEPPMDNVRSFANAPVTNASLFSNSE